MSAAGDSRSWLVRAQCVNAGLQGNPGHAHGEVIVMPRMYECRCWHSQNRSRGQS